MTKRTIVVVDDSKADQFLSKRVIHKFYPSIEVLQAYDGREALAVLDGLSEPPALVFLDINMPVMNGHEFLAEYKTRDTAAAVVVMLTSSVADIDKNKAKTFACVKAYLTKPLSIEALVSVLALPAQSPVRRGP